MQVACWNSMTTVRTLARHTQWSHIHCKRRTSGTWSKPQSLMSSSWSAVSMCNESGSLLWLASCALNVVRCCSAVMSSGVSSNSSMDGKWRCLNSVSSRTQRGNACKAHKDDHSKDLCATAVASRTYAKHWPSWYLQHTEESGRSLWPQYCMIHHALQKGQKVAGREAPVLTCSELPVSNSVCSAEQCGISKLSM